MTTKEQTRYKVVQSDGSERLMTAEELCTKPLVHPAETQGKLAAFDDLVKACEALLADPEDIVIHYERHPDGYPEGLANLIVTLDQLDDLRAALAKAKGETRPAEPPSQTSPPAGLG